MVTAGALAFFAHILLHTVWLGPAKAEGHKFQGLGEEVVYEKQNLNKRLRHCAWRCRLAIEVDPGIFV